MLLDPPPAKLGEIMARHLQKASMSADFWGPGKLKNRDLGQAFRALKESAKSLSARTLSQPDMQPGLGVLGGYRV